MNRILHVALLSVLGVAVIGADGAMAKTKKHKTTTHHAAAAPADVKEVPTVPHAGEKPLMVVRFNETTVPYEWPLYNTLTKALEVQPQAQFDVVSVAPRSHDLTKQVSDNDTATQDLTKVLGTLKEIGMPENRYTVSKIYDDVKTSEVRFYIH